MCSVKRVRLISLLVFAKLLTCKAGGGWDEKAPWWEHVFCTREQLCFGYYFTQGLRQRRADHSGSSNHCDQAIRDTVKVMKAKRVPNQPLTLN